MRASHLADDGGWIDAESVAPRYKLMDGEIAFDALDLADEGRWPFHQLRQIALREPGLLPSLYQRLDDRLVEG